VTPVTPFDPCFVPARAPLSVDRRVRVIEVLATGTNGGAQEHLYSLLMRMDHSRYDVSVASLSPGSAVRKLQRAGFPVLVIDEPDDAIAVGALAVLVCFATALAQLRRYFRRGQTRATHLARAEVPAPLGEDLREDVSIREDPDEPVPLADERAAGLPVAHPADEIGDGLVGMRPDELRHLDQRLPPDIDFAARRRRM